MLYLVGSLVLFGIVALAYSWVSANDSGDSLYGDGSILETRIVGLGLLVTTYGRDRNKYSFYHRNGSIEDLKNYINTFKHQQFRRKVLFAELSGKYGKEDVTGILKMAQGLKSDFHLGLTNAVTTWDDILYEFDLSDWNRLTIIDSFGKVHNIEIAKDRVIEWSNEFKLD